MYKAIIFLLLATSTLTYGGCFLQDADLIPQQEMAEAANISYDSYKTPSMQRGDLMPYLKSANNPVKIADYCRFIYKKGGICDQSEVIYACVASDGSHVQIFEAKDEDKQLSD